MGPRDAVLIPIASSLAAALSTWIVIRGRGVRGLPGCGAGSGCDAVTRSRWSKFGNIPVALAGAVVYLATAVAAAATQIPVHLQLRDVSQAVVMASVPLLAGAALWFLLLQFFVVRRFCPYCTLTHAFGLVVVGVVVHGLVTGQGFTAVGQRVSHVNYVFLPGIIALAILVGGQVLLRPRSFVVTRDQGNGRQHLIGSGPSKSSVRSLPLDGRGKG